MIYYLHEDPAICAQMLYDRTLDKQIKAIAQVLCNVHHELRTDATNSLSWPGIPLDINTDTFDCTYEKWASECLANYKKLVDMGLACCEEYNWRFSTYLLETQHPKEVKHKLQPVIEWCDKNVPDLPEVVCDENYIVIDPQPFPIVMPKKYICHIALLDDPNKIIGVHTIQSYRNYYRTKIAKFYKRCEEQHDCCLYANKGKYCIRQNLPKWTRRERPEWLMVI